MNNSTALVTGANKGIGKEIARQFAAAGLTVYVGSRAAASDGDPAEGAAGAVRLALLPDDGPTGEFLSWDGTAVPW